MSVQPKAEISPRIDNASDFGMATAKAGIIRRTMLLLRSKSLPEGPDWIFELEAGVLDWMRWPARRLMIEFATSSYGGSSMVTIRVCLG